MDNGLKIFKAELPYFEKIELIPMADTHIGDANTDENAVISLINYVLEQPNRYVILNGDIVNMALKNSKSDIYSSIYSIEGELNRAVEIFKPLADAKRILAMQPGNHEDRVYKDSGLDVGAWLAERLGIADKYTNNSFVLFIKFGRSPSWTPNKNAKNVYSVFVRHGVGGAGRKAGSKLNKVMEMAETIDCDIHIMSHVHDPILKPTIRFKCNPQNMTVSPTKVDYIVTNSFQSFGGYGQKLGFPPSTMEISYIILNGNGPKQTILVSGIENNKL